MTCGRHRGRERLALSALVVLSIFVGWQEMASAASKVTKETKSKTAVVGSSNKSGAALPKAVLNGKELSALTQLRTAIGAGLDFHEMTLPSGVRAYAVVIDTKRGAWNIAPSINKPIAATTKSAQLSNAWAAINGGYFNMSDGDSVSFVTIDGKQVCDPNTNKALVENEKLKPFLPQIFNREEFRVYADKKGKRCYSIEKHDAPVPAGSKLVSALQGGPMLLPAYTAREGAFVRTDASGVESDSIGTAKPAARTAIGIASDAVVLLIVEGRRTKEFSTGATLPELADFFTKVGCNQALNFDGGTSTTLVVKLPHGTEGSQSEVSCDGTNGADKTSKGADKATNGALKAPNGADKSSNGADKATNGALKASNGMGSAGSDPSEGVANDPSESGSKAEGVNNLKVASGSSQTSVLKTIFSSSPERRVKSVLIVTQAK